MDCGNDPEDNQHDVIRRIGECVVGAAEEHQRRCEKACCDRKRADQKAGGVEIGEDEIEQDRRQD